MIYNKHNINNIKIGFLDIEKDEIFKLENYCVKWGIKQNKWKKDFTYELQENSEKDLTDAASELNKEKDQKSPEALEKSSQDL